MTENDPFTHFNINGYQTIESKLRKTRIRRGDAFHTKTGVESEVFEYESEFECLVGRFAFELHFEKKNFCVVYRPDSVRFKSFSDLTKSLLGFLRPQKMEFILFVAFTVITLIEDTEKKIGANLLASVGYKVQKPEPTSVTSVSCTNHIIPTDYVNTKTVKITVNDHYIFEVDLFLLDTKNSLNSNYAKHLVRNLNNIRKKTSMVFFLLEQNLHVTIRNRVVDNKVKKILGCIWLADCFVPEKPPGKQKQKTWIKKKLKPALRNASHFFTDGLRIPQKENDIFFKSPEAKLKDRYGMLKVNKTPNKEATMRLIKQHISN